MKRKKKIFESPEERAAWKARHEERQRELEYSIERAKAELGVDHQQELEYYIERAKADLEAKRESA